VTLSLTQTPTPSLTSISDLKGKELLESLGLCLEKELELLSTPTAYEKIQNNAAHQ